MPPRPPLGRDFRLYAAGRAVSNVGDRVALIALVFLVVHLSAGSAPALALFYVCRLLPRIRGGLVAGLVVDHVDRRRLMLACDIVRAVLLALVPAATSSGWWTIYPTVFVLYALTLLFDTAASAALPDVVPESRMTTANAVLNGLGQASDVFYALGGVLIFTFGYRVPFFIDAVTFAFSALMVAVMRLPKTAHDGAAAPGQMIQRIRVGISFIREQPFLKWSALTFALAPFAGGIAFVLTPLYANHALAGTPHLVGPLRSGAFRFSVLEVVLGAGALLGSAASVRLAARWPRGRLFGLGLSGMGVSEALLALTHNLYVVCPILVIDGIFNGVFFVAGMTLTQTLTPSEMRGRVLAANQTLANSALALGSACSGALLLKLSYPQLWLVAGVIIELASLFVWLRPEVRSQA